MKNDFTKTNLFSCPIYKIRIDPNSYDKEKILKDIKYNKNLKNIRNDAHQVIGNQKQTNIHHSYQDHYNENFRIINYEKLSDAYLEIFKEFFEKEIINSSSFSWKFEIVNYSAISEGQYLLSHDHIPTSDFASIHYLNFKDDHNFTSFNNPATGVPYLNYIQRELMDVLDFSALDNSYFWRHFEFSVEEDDMIIFPSALVHEVLAQKPTKEPRITISANMCVLPQV